MKFNLNNPAFLQMAGNAQAKEYITMVFSAADQSAIISAEGDLLVTTIKNGQIVDAVYSNPSSQKISFEADENSVVTLTGKVKSIYGGNGPFYLSNLISIDVTHAKSLISLKAGEAKVSSLDVSQNTALTELSIGNALTSLDVSKNAALTFLSVGSLSLTSLDVSKNTALTYLNIGNTAITSLDLSKNIALASFFANNGALTSLDLSNNTELTEIQVSDCALTSLDLSNNTKLTRVSAQNNELTTINLSNLVSLTSFYASNNKCTSFDLINNINLNSLQITNNETVNYISVVAENQSVASNVASTINGSTVTNGTLVVRSNDQYASIPINAATTKGWTVEYVNA